MKGFGCHRDRTVHFDPGVNGLLGPIGSGKTTTLDAVVYALTGSLPSGATKEDCRPFDAAEGEASWVELSFRCPGGQEAVVRRTLGSSGHELSVPALGKKWTARKDVQEQL